MTPKVNQANFMEDPPRMCNCVSTALIVDDDEFNLIPLYMILQQRNINAMQASNGAQAVELFR